jgi:hypothetical protein
VTACQSKIRLDFKKLPLVEAAIRASFATPIKITYAMIYRLRDTLTEYRELMEPEFFEARPGFPGTFQLSPGDLPGAVFSGNRIGLSLSVQSQVMVVRWSRRSGSDSPDYPRYPALRDSLWDSVTKLAKACETPVPRIAVVNMSYVNSLQVPHGAPVLQTYFAPTAHVQAALGAKELRKLEASWMDADDIDIRYHLEQVTLRIVDQEVQGYALTTAAGKRMGPSVTPKAELDNVHARLQVFFRDLISKQAQDEWELTVADSA